MTRVLLAEDDPGIQHLGAYQPTSAGFGMLGVSDDLAAAAARRDRPGAVLAGVRMPIVIRTARARPQDIEATYAAGAADHVVQPSSPRELLQRVEAALVGRVRTRC